MPSLISGYEYDIFISYRQNDNRSGWVTEFVNALKEELAATIKDPVSVYFDANPHDGLLETHNVDKSLEGKLKCLIFIPIISQTYCDRKTFAWQHEFCAFNKLSKEDLFGRDIKLSSGNVASRILPVRIHDLDADDQASIENETGGILRAIEFIFNSPGVNRPLRANEDHPHDNLKKTYFRDQVNKVANAVKEIISALVKPGKQAASTKVTTPLPYHKDSGPMIAPEQVALKEPYKKSKGRDPSASHEGTSFGPGHKLVKAGLAIMFLAISVFAIWFFHRQSKIRWAEEEVLPEIERLIGGSDFLMKNLTDPYRLALQAETYIPNSPKLADLFSKCSFSIAIMTDPPGAKVYMNDYKTPNSEWEYIGTTPMDSVRVPIGIFRWRIEKEGYEPVMAAAATYDLDLRKPGFYVPYHLSRSLSKQASSPVGMVRVTDPRTSADKLGDFYIDKYEVTNKQYKEFINSGGYRVMKYWRHEFSGEKKLITWEEAMAEFVDQSGRPGPSAWQGGDYPEGHGDYPVSGISWYEAAAYTEFAGKSLPTRMHWNIARGAYTPFLRSPHPAYAVVFPFSNFGGSGPVPVGSLQGISVNGAFDLAGNVREWCWNETAKGRLIRGGAWDDPVYMFGNLTQVPPMDRSVKNGFRCALYPDQGKIPKEIFAAIKLSDPPDFYKQEPASDAVFQVYKNQFSYDKTDLSANTEIRIDSNDSWVMEYVTFNAAYGNERMMAYLFLPKNTSPPYQTVVYFPGSGAALQSSSNGLKHNEEFRMLLSFIVKNGRAVLFPVYKGTFEREGGGPFSLIHGGNGTHSFSEYLVYLVKDFKRCMDYLGTREDIDSGKIAYCGLSWGAWMGSFIPAVEERIRVNVLVAGGFFGRGLPEANEINYITRIHAPTLMLNGKYDASFPLETSVKPMFDLMGTPSEHKELRVYESDHIPPRNDIIKEILAWLDRYLGPVK